MKNFHLATALFLVHKCSIFISVNASSNNLLATLAASDNTAAVRPMNCKPIYMAKSHASTIVWRWANIVWAIDIHVGTQRMNFKRSLYYSILIIFLSEWQKQKYNTSVKHHASK